MRTSYFIFILTLCTTGICAQQQNPTPLRVFLDNTVPEAVYLRSEVPWVSYTRNRAEADILVQYTPETLAAGRRGILYFFSNSQYGTLNDTIVFDLRPGENYSSVRERTLRAYKRGLLGYLLVSDWSSAIEYQAVDSLSFAQPVSDQWGRWVAQVGIDGYFNINKQVSSNIFIDDPATYKILNYNIRPILGFWRVTPLWRIWNTVNIKQVAERNMYKYGTIIDTASSTNSTSNLSLGAAYSIHPHWSAGAWANYNFTHNVVRRTGRFFAPAANINQKTWTADLNGGIEYSLFPYTTFFRKRLLMGYYLSAISTQLTRNSMLTRPLRNNMYIDGAVLQKWGVLSGSVTVQHQPRKLVWDTYNIRYSILSAINLKRNLYLNLNAGLEHGNTEQFDLVLPGFPIAESRNARHLNLIFGAGFTYSFGAHDLNVINPRMGGQ